MVGCFEFLVGEISVGFVLCAIFLFYGARLLEANFVGNDVLAASHGRIFGCVVVVVMLCLLCL